MDLTGLIESTVDSDEDEEDLMATMDSINPRLAASTYLAEECGLFSLVLSYSYN